MEDIIGEDVVTKFSMKCDSAIIDLLICHTRATDTLIVKFHHETLGEYLIAKSIVDAFFQGNIEEINNVMNIIYNYEINLFVRYAFKLLNNIQQNNIIKKKKKVYNANFNDDFISVRIREQVIYYTGRLPCLSKETKMFLRLAYENENNSIIKRSAAISLILLGDEDIETQYISQLIREREADIENRSVQLIYFGDTQGDIHTFRDDGTCSWLRTKVAIINRLSENSRRAYNLRFWDLVTLFSFLNNRGIDNMTKDDIFVIQESLIDGIGSSNRQNHLREFKNKIISLFC
jgi:hypothetical protein